MLQQNFNYDMNIHDGLLGLHTNVLEWQKLSINESQIHLF